MEKEMEKTVQIERHGKATGIVGWIHLYLRDFIAYQVRPIDEGKGKGKV